MTQVPITSHHFHQTGYGAAGAILPLPLESWDDRQVPHPPSISVDSGTFDSHTWHFTCEPVTPGPTSAS